MYILSEEIEDYCALCTAPEPPLLAELNRVTHLRVLHPRMLSGHVQGRLLSLLSRLLRPARILEVGTYTGYSALCLAEGLDNGGELITIDNNAELRDIQDEFFGRAGYGAAIRPITGEALSIIPALVGTWDLVFLDADKENYPAYLRLVRERIRPGGLLIADNVLWSGKVTAPHDPADVATAALKEFNLMLACDPLVRPVMLSVRDGLTVARKEG